MSNSNDDRRPGKQDEGQKAPKGQEQQRSDQGKSSSGQQGGHQRQNAEQPGGKDHKGGPSE